MIVTIVRHGEAADAASDRARVLTPRGESDIQAAAGHLEAACRSTPGCSPVERIVHSPWVRTQQTAALLASPLHCTAVEPLSVLQPGGTVEGVESALEEISQAGCKHVVLVSHQPLVSYLTNYFVEGADRLPGMMPGAFTTLSLNPVAPLCARVVFWATPPTYAVHQ